MTSLPEAPQPKRTVWTALGMSGVASAAASGTDVLALVVLVEVVGLHYAVSTALGALLGAGVNFVLGRYWVFLAAEGAVMGQAVRYGLVVLSSVAWNTAAVYAFTEALGVPYLASRLAAAVLVALLHNFPLLRWVVFRVPNASP